MYLNDCIRSVRRLYPSEYDEEEMYLWCDEVSAMLAVEDRNVFREVVLRADAKGTFLLPEDVDTENIESVIMNGKPIEKADLGSIAKDGKIRSGCGGAIRVVYREPYYPIRLIKYRGAVTVSENGTSLKLPLNEFMAGDIICIKCGEHTAENVSLFETEYTSADICILKTGKTGIPDGEYGDCSIVRRVTDQTVCKAPYDSMYIDYILAKINMFQRDMQGYNHHMTAFNSRLAAYKKWLINHMPQGENKFKNWW